MDLALIAQRIAHQVPDLKVGGSNPSGGTHGTMVSHQEKSRRVTERSAEEFRNLTRVVPEGDEVEPVALIDISGSMGDPAAPGSHILKYQVVTEAMRTIVRLLYTLDSQAESELAAGEDKGGLLVFTFSHEANEVGDLTPDNFDAKWGAIEWGGGTQIVPAWDLATEAYDEEFGDKPKLDRPRLLALIITDGEAQDSKLFQQQLMATKGSAYICVCIIGHGSAHDETLTSYAKIADTNKHVRVVSFDSLTSAATLADAVKSLLGVGE